MHRAILRAGRWWINPKGRACRESESHKANQMWQKDCSSVPRARLADVRTLVPEKATTRPACAAKRTCLSDQVKQGRRGEPQQPFHQEESNPSDAHACPPDIRPRKKSKKKGSGVFIRLYRCSEPSVRKRGLMRPRKDSRPLYIFPKGVRRVVKHVDLSRSIPGRV
jgi:hypothetical protein